MTPDSESFADFKNSFSYGTRTDLTFKFLSKLLDDDAAEFLRLLLHEVGETLDDGDLGRIHRLVFEWQVKAYAPDLSDSRGKWSYAEGPFAPLRRPLAESRIGLLTSSGHFAAGSDPEPFGESDMTQEQAIGRISDFLRATPKLSSLPAGTAPDDIRVRHGGYDVRSAVRDYNVAFPRDALHRAAEAGRVGEVAPELYSFVGATSQGRLRRQALPGWVTRLREAEIDVLLLVPV